MNGTPADSAEICQRLLRGYQFSSTDLENEELASYYLVLEQYFEWFHRHMLATGFQLIQDDGVILLEKEEKALTEEEKQTIVVLFLLVDLWLDQGQSLGDLFTHPVSIDQLPWFRDGYGRDYLAQVKIMEIQAIEDLFHNKLSRRGLVTYHPHNRMIFLRKPASRLLTLAHSIYAHSKEKIDGQ